MPPNAFPKQYIRDAAAIGSTQECVGTVRRFRDAGADEDRGVRQHPGAEREVDRRLAPGRAMTTSRIDVEEDAR